MRKKLLHLFIPHPETHKKAPLLSPKFLLVYLLIFILIRTVLDVVSVFQPGVLGVNSTITISQVIEETNKERQKADLPILVENSALNQAAVAKAQNMFAENYWAHFSPSGKDPWGFITSSGYKFSFAGENLAKNFQTSEDVVVAWMNSPTHRDNILNSKYQDIGIGVVEGVLNGQQTTLVVQMFGRQYDRVPAVSEVSAGGQKVSVKPEEIKPSPPVLVAGSNVQVAKPAIIDPNVVTKASWFSLISFITFLLLLDLIILKKRGVFRFSSHHVAHMGLLTLGGASMILSRVGEIL